MNDLITRAFAAYFRNLTNDGVMPNQPSSTASGVVEHDGRKYVVLRNTDALLAVYRVKTDGFLKRLDRWPKAIE